MPKRARSDPQLARPGIRRKPREALRDLIKQYRQKLAIGVACYQKADELLAQIQAKCPPGKRIPLGDGLYAVIVDLFAETDKVFKPMACKRFELQIQDAGGRVVRMRDRKKTAKTKTK